MNFKKKSWKNIENFLRKSILKIENFENRKIFVENFEKSKNQKSKNLHWNFSKIENLEILNFRFSKIFNVNFSIFDFSKISVKFWFFKISIFKIDFRSKVFNIFSWFFLNRFRISGGIQKSWREMRSTQRGRASEWNVATTSFCKSWH